MTLVFGRRVYLMSEPLWDEAWMRTGKEQRLPSTQQLEVELKMNQIIERHAAIHEHYMFNSV